MLAFIFGLFSPLKSVLSLIERNVSNETERERIKAETVQAYVNAQASVLTGRGWFFPLFFIAPTALHYAAVNIYSVFWCARCAYPQAWTIAALPTPFDQWEGVIVTSMFLGSAGGQILAKWRR